MQIRVRLASFSLLAYLGALAGCGDDIPGQQNGGSGGSTGGSTGGSMAGAGGSVGGSTGGSVGGSTAGSGGGGTGGGGTGGSVGGTGGRGGTGGGGTGGGGTGGGGTGGSVGGTGGRGGTGGGGTGGGGTGGSVGGTGGGGTGGRSAELAAVEPAAADRRLGGRDWRRRHRRRRDWRRRNRWRRDWRRRNRRHRVLHGDVRGADERRDADRRQRHHDMTCADGFQYTVAITTNAPAGTMVQLFNNGTVLLATATVASGAASFAVQLPSSGQSALSIQFPSTAACTDAQSTVTVNCPTTPPTCTISQPTITGTHSKLNGVLAPAGDRASQIGSPYQVTFTVTTNAEDGQPVTLSYNDAATPGTVMTAERNGQRRQRDVRGAAVSGRDVSGPRVV